MSVAAVVAPVSVAYVAAFAITTAIFSLRPQWLARCCAVPVVSTARFKSPDAESAGGGGPQWHRLDASHLYRGILPSPLTGPVVVLVLRLLFPAAVVVFLALEFEGPKGLFTGKRDADWAAEFSNWVLVLFAAQGAVGAAVSVRGLKRGLLREKPQEYDWLDKLYTVLFSVNSSAVYVTVFYWAVLWTGPSVEIDSVFKHGGVAFLILLESFLSRTPMVSTWLVFPALLMLLYAVFLWLYRAASGDWVYNSLAWSPLLNLVYYAVLPILVVISFWIAFLVVTLREWMFGPIVVIMPDVSIIDMDPANDTVKQLGGKEEP